VFGVDEGADAAILLRFGHVHGAPASSCPRLSGPKISTMRPRGKPPMPSAMSRPSEPVEIDLDFNGFLVFAQPHDRAFAEGAFDLRQGGVERLGLVHGRSFHEAKIRLSHG
jgi:hypothetical protein